MNQSGEDQAASQSWIRRHKVLVAVLLVMVLAAAPIAWYLGSPLFIDKRVDEEFPVATAPAETRGAPVASQTAPAASQTQSPVQLSTGQLRGIDHRSSGSATTYRLSDGSQILRLDHDTQNGPDLYVYLIGSSDYRAKADASDFVDLGKLKGNQGQQNYEIPPGTDLTRYKTVMIWCKQFDTPFAAAPLNT
ncbi:MAG: electron transporter [Acidobacteria bacterium]|nr:MAG: electron transporter [Acidobacteriota bacterium]